MTRSHRKTPIFPNAGSSDRSYKTLLHRKNRRLANQACRELLDDEDPEFEHVDDPFSNWVSDKDGKHYWPDATKKDLSK